jgi:hypothetical protein
MRKNTWAPLRRVISNYSLRKSNEKRFKENLRASLIAKHQEFRKFTEIYRLSQDVCISQTKATSYTTKRSERLYLLRWMTKIRLFVPFQLSIRSHLESNETNLGEVSRTIYKLFSKPSRTWSMKKNCESKWLERGAAAKWVFRLARRHKKDSESFSLRLQ